MAKKTAIFVLILVGVSFTGIVAYKLVSPEIVIVNQSPQEIRQVVIHLPSNRITFGEIAPGSEDLIYYSVSQADGRYDYSLTLSDGSSISGSCGYATNSEFGKRIQLVLNVFSIVECRESNKIF